MKQKTKITLICLAMVLVTGTLASLAIYSYEVSAKNYLPISDLSPTSKGGFYSIEGYGCKYLFKGQDVPVNSVYLPLFKDYGNQRVYPPVVCYDEVSRMRQAGLIK